MRCATGIKENFVIRIGKRRVQIRGVFFHTILCRELLEFVSTASSENRVGHDAFIATDHATLLTDGENGAHEVLIGAHASGDAVHDNANVACIHKCLIKAGIAERLEAGSDFFEELILILGPVAIRKNFHFGHACESCVAHPVIDHFHIRHTFSGKPTV